ncbi:MAG: hypothetical protein ACT4OE_06045 [Sphingosinicella sp.]
MKRLTIALSTSFLFTLAACDQLGLGPQASNEANAANASETVGADATGDKPTDGTATSGSTPAENAPPANGDSDKPLVDAGAEGGADASADKPQ